MNENELSENFKWNVIKSYFDKKGFIDHQITTFNDYINSGIQRVVKECDIIVNQKELKYTVNFGEVYIPTPKITEEDRKVRLLFPLEARTKDLNYDSPIFVDIKETIEIEGQEPEINLHERIKIGRTPIMLRSEKCNLSNSTKNDRIKNGECEWDNGGYFIIKGKERVLVGQLRGIYNQPLVLCQKSGEKYKYICDVRSMSEETGHSVLLQVKIGNDDRNIVFSLPYIKEIIPVGIVFKALGFLENEEIADIIGDNENKDIQRYIKYIIRDSYFIKTQEDALKHIGQFSMHVIKEDKRKDYALQVVENELLPHMGITSTIKEKAYFLGHMVNKLLKTNLGLRSEDDRDNYSNKRVEMAGVLCCELFRTLFKRFTKNIETQLERKKQRPDVLSIISRNTSITLGLKHAFCFPAGTLITMSNGLSLPIERLADNSNEHEKVYGWNGNGLIITKHGGLMNQGMKETIKLTLEDGRTVICTPDHKILVLKEDKTTEWVEALKIPIDSRIVCGIEYPEDTYIDEDLDSKWDLKINDKIFTLKNQNERNKTLAFMRILGYIICDGHIPDIKNNQAAIYFGNMIDVNSFIEDYKLVTEIDETPKIKDVKTENWGSNYLINLSNEFTNLLRSIEGVLKGKKVTQERQIPLFILEDDCPKSVIREFLGGMFGADGHSLKLDIREKRRTCVYGVKFSWTTEEKNLIILKDLFENICKLLKKLGVKDAYVSGPLPPSSGPADRFYYLINIPSNTTFTKFIGFRYCIHKSYKSCILSSYLRMCEEIKRQHDYIIKEVDILKENDKKMTFKKALEIVRKKLIQEEYILNEYYSLSSERDVSKRREKGRSKTLELLEEKYDVIDVVDFIKNTGFSYIFNKEYVIKRDSDNIPIFSLKLKDIRNYKKQIVYDITNVNICHSFLADGIVSSNSVGSWGVQKNNYIRTGVSQVLSRMTFSATLSHLRRIIIPIGKEGKNTKLRQTHSSQIMYICPNECFDPNTPILLWDGSIKLAKDIIVGDLLIDDNGNPTRVRSTCSGMTTMYEIKQEKLGYTNYTVTDNHILTLKIRNQNYLFDDNNCYAVYFLNKITFNYETRYFNNKNEAIEYLNLLKKEDNIIDIKIEDYLKLSSFLKNCLEGFKVNDVNWKKNSTCIDSYKYGLNELNESSCNIKKEYLINDRDTRLKLLKGIIENFGFEKNVYKIYILNPKNIKKDIIFLVNSLGYHYEEYYKNIIIYGINKEEIDKYDIKINYIKNKINSSIEVVKKGIEQFVGWQLEGNGRFLLSDFTTVHNTPEGQSIGIVLNLALSTTVTRRIPTVVVKEIIENCENFIFLNEYKGKNNQPKIFLNGILLGVTETLEEFIKELKFYRKNGLLDKDISFTYNKVDNEIKIFSDEGRFIRPIFTLNDEGKLYIDEKVDSPDWDELLEKQYVQYIDNSEIENSVVAMNEKDLVKYKNDFCEICPAMMMGVVSSLIPFPEHNPSARNIFQSNMGKQSIGMPALSYQVRSDTILHVLDYPQKGIVNTIQSELMGLNDMPYGINAIVAVMPFEGWILPLLC